MVEQRTLDIPGGVSIPVFYFSHPGHSGPTVYIQAGIHGAELQGSAVIHRLMALFRQAAADIRGTIICVPLCNPWALMHKSGEYLQGRFDPVTGENWNRHYLFDDTGTAAFAAAHLDASDDDVKRAFRAHLGDQLSQRQQTPYGLSRAQGLCYALQSLAQTADIVLDLHTGPVAAPHLYVPAYARDLAQDVPIELQINIPNGFDGALDEASFCPWWDLSEAFGDLGRDFPVMVEAYTVELGSQEQVDWDVADRQASGFFAFLQKRGVIGGELVGHEEIEPYRADLADYRIIYAPQTGMYEFMAQPGSRLQAGDVIARYVSDADWASGEIQEIVAPTAGALVLHYASAWVPAGAELAKILVGSS